MGPTFRVPPIADPHTPLHRSTPLPSRLKGMCKGHGAVAHEHDVA